MFELISRAFIYASLATPIIIARSMFFPFISGKALFFRTVIELAVLCFAIHIALSKHRGALLADIWKKLKQPLVVALALLTTIFIITAFTGINSTQSFWSNFERGEGAFQIFHYFLFFVMIVLLFPTRKAIERLLYTHIGVSIVVSLYGLGQLLTKADPQNFFLAAGGRISGTLGNPSYLACYALITIAILAYFFLRTRLIEWKIVYAATALFETFILIKTGTRGAFLALVIGILVVLCIMLFIAQQRKTKLIIGSILGVLLIFGGVFMATRTSPVWQNVPVFGRVLDVQSVENGFQPRLWTWESAFSGFLERPVLGYGAENFAYSFDKYYNPKHFGRESFFDRTHNIVLEHMIAGGALLLLSWIGVLWSYGWALRKQPKNLWFAISVAVPVAYVVQGIFLFDVLPIYLALYLFFALTLTPDETGNTVRIHAGYDTRPGAVAVSIACAAAIGVSLFYTSYQPLQKNKALTTAIISESNGNVVATAQAYLAAIETSSPVGQEEAISMYIKYVMNAIDRIDQNVEYSRDENAQKILKALVDDANTLFAQHADIMKGQKNDYLLGAMNIRLGISFTDPKNPRVKHADYLAKGKAIYEAAVAFAPTRIEFFKVLYEVAKIEKDTARAEQLRKQILQLRPDLGMMN